MMRSVFALLACSSLVYAQCRDGQCADRLSFEGDAEEGSLVQLRRHEGAGAPNLNPTDPHLPLLVFGTAVTSFHNVTMQVYAKAMRLLGYQVKVIWQYPHDKMYTMFVGGGGLAAKPPCKDDGCSELCAENGLGNKSPCIDFTVDANIPINHDKYIEAYQDEYNVIGTAYNPFFINLFTPRYSKFRTLTGAAASSTVEKKIIGFKTGIENNCSTFFCPVCGTGKVEYITGPPLGTNGFSYEAFRCDEFEKVMEGKLREKSEFIVFMFTPSAWTARFPEMVPMDLQNYSYQIKPSSGKSLLRKASAHKFSEKARAVLQGLYIGKEGVEQMDGWAHGFNNDPPGPLCEYQSFNHACAAEAADKWIKQNQNYNALGVKGSWPSFFW